jgi:hypothetical protein
LKIVEPCYGGGCVTEYCFNAILPGGVIPAGVCACNSSNNAGCKDPYKCDFSPLVEIGHLTAFIQWAQQVTIAANAKRVSFWPLFHWPVCLQWRLW